MRPIPKAIIFDYGNVLSQPQPAADVQSMSRILELPIRRFEEIYWQFRVPYDAAEFSPADYWNEVAGTASRSLTTAQIERLIDIDSRSWSHPAPITPYWARDLQASGLRTAVLSNMPFPVRDYVLTCDWLPKFDVRVFSCEFGRTKPSPEIYEYCLDQLRIAPGDALFLDDKEPNLRAAEALGLAGVLFQDPTAAFREITRRFDLPVPATELR